MLTDYLFARIGQGIMGSIRHLISRLRGFMLKYRLAAILCLIIFFMSGVPVRAQQQRAEKKVAAVPAKPFSTVDLSGRRLTLNSLKGSPAVLLFFCGCDYCHRFARSWSALQRSGAFKAEVLAPNAKFSAKAPKWELTTLVFFAEGADAARAFVNEVGLDAAKTRVSADPEMKTARDYDALTCPRIFVLDSHGSIRYDNHHKDDDAHRAPDSVIISRAIDALQACAREDLQQGK